KDGSFRPAVDFRKLNKVTRAYRFPMPNITELIQSLKGATVFSAIDLMSAFWQVPLTDKAAKKTTFTTRRGHFKFKVLAFGFVDASSVFNQLMSSVLSDVLGLSALVYLDDIVIFSKDVQSHFEQLEQALHCIRGAGLKINLSKSVFLKKELKFLSHTISKDGIRTDESKEETIRDCPTPTNKDEIRSFVGVVNYYRQFVEGFAHIASPLTDMLKNYVKFVWKAEQEGAFTKIKECLLSKLALMYPDFDRPFVICTDSSGLGIGAALGRQQGQRLLPISFASKTLTKTER
ncbi:Reverse transcriptase domain, partial [Trinorchestia longiramus]